MLLFLKMSIQDTLFHASKIAEYIHALYDSPDFKISSHWQGHYPSGPNPYYFQTEQGLFLEETPCGSLSYIWTPLGRWTILGSIFTEDRGAINKLRNKLFEYVKVKEYLPMPDCKYPNRGVVWKIKGYKRISLPEAISKISGEFIKYSDAKKMFDTFTSKNPL
jgi:hypothetical protein